MNTTTTLTLNNKVSSGLYALYLDTSKTLPFSSRLAPWHGEGSSTIRRPTSAFNCTSPMCSWNIIICQALTLIFLLSTQCINSLYPRGCKLVLDHNLLPIRLFLFSLSSIVESTLKRENINFQLPFLTSRMSMFLLLKQGAKKVSFTACKFRQAVASIY